MDAPVQSMTFSKCERVYVHTKSARTERSLHREAGRKMSGRTEDAARLQMQFSSNKLQ